MRPKVVKHWLTSAAALASNNYNERPDPQDISLLVVHNISLPPGEFGGPYINQFFTNRLDPEAHPYFREICNLQVSAHLLIRRDGSLVQYVPFNRRAWHAGASVFHGKENCNDFSIGIELEGSDELAYETKQYRVLAQVTQALICAYPDITQDRIVGHSDIAPGRKTDPGPAFDWIYFRQALAEQLKVE